MFVTVESISINHECWDYCIYICRLQEVTYSMCTWGMSLSYSISNLIWHHM